MYSCSTEEGRSNLSTVKMNYTKPSFCKNYIVWTMQQGMALLFYLEYKVP